MVFWAKRFQRREERDRNARQRWFFVFLEPLLDTLTSTVRVTEVTIRKIISYADDMPVFVSKTNLRKLFDSINKQTLSTKVWYWPVNLWNFEKVQKCRKSEGVNYEVETKNSKSICRKYKHCSTDMKVFRKKQKQWKFFSCQKFCIWPDTNQVESFVKFFKQLSLKNLS